MVVLNGIKEKEAQYTCKAVRGEGIDDYIAVSCGLVERMSDIEYWKNEESDHIAIACKMRMKGERKMKEREEEKKKVCFKIVDNTLSWKFWRSIKGICDERMEKVMEKIENMEDVEQCWNIVRKEIRQMLEFGGKKGKRKEVEDEEMKEMKKELTKLKKEKSKSHIEQGRFKMLKNRVEKVRKKIGKKRMKDKVLELMLCRGKEEKRFWVKLKELGGWRKGGSKIPDTALDERGIERGGSEKLAVWRDAFHKLGTDDPNDPDFDREHARKIEEEVRKVEARNRRGNEETEEKKDEEDENEGCDEEEKAHRKELHENITQEEVSKAIDQLQNYRAPGQDG
jgi:hypothetical protein